MASCWAAFSCLPGYTHTLPRLRLLEYYKTKGIYLTLTLPRKFTSETGMQKTISPRYQ